MKTAHDARLDRLRAWLTSSDAWYLLIRTPRGYERIPTTLSAKVRIEIDDEAGLFRYWATDEVTLDPDNLVAGRVVEVGLFNPDLNPDPLDRGEPLPERVPPRQT